MENIIKVTPDVLINTSNEFSTQGSQIGSLTTQMMDLINGLPSSWVGEAGSTYVSRFAGLSDDMSRITNMITEHAEDLVEMAQNYITTEQQIGDMAQSLASDVIV